MLLLSLLLFPKLALGLSGFETGVAVMPLIKGDPGRSRRAARWAAFATPASCCSTAALIMSVFLLGSALVTATLIPPQDLRKSVAAEEPGPRPTARWPTWRTAKGRVQINPLFGEMFGTIYDLSTVVILSFAGLSAMAGLLNLVPQYLPRYGMAPEWSRAVRPLVLLFTAINLLVTWIFRRRRRGAGRRLRHGRAGADLQRLRGHGDRPLSRCARGPWLGAACLGPSC